MTLLRELYQAITTRAHNQERPPSINLGAGMFTSGGIGSGNLLQQMTTYSTVSWVFAAVSRIAEAVAASEWKLYRGPGTANEVDVHPALRLWESANPFDTRQEFLEMSQQHFELTGEMWWVLVRNGRGVPVEMWSVRPDRMTPVRDRDTYVKGYIYQIGSERIPFDVDDVIFLRRPSPLDVYRGMGPIGSLILDLGSEVEAANFNRAFFRNNALPGGVIETDRSMSNADFKQFVDRWQTMHQGTANVGRMAFLERATFKDRKYTQRDMQFAQLREQTRNLVLAAYGVPLPMLGVMEAPSRANAQAAEFIFARWTIKPRLERIKQSLNTRLLRLFPDRGLHFGFTDPTPNNRELDLEEATKAYPVGILTLNEARARLRQDELPGGDTVFQPSGPAIASGFTAHELPPGIKAQLTNGLRSQLKAPEPLEIAERAMELAWKRRLQAEAEGLVEYLDEILAKRFHVLAKIEPGDVEGYDWNWWVKYKDQVIEELTAALRISIISEWPQVEPLIADQLAGEYAEARGARLLRVDGDLNMVNATKARVNTLVSQTIERGDSLQTLQRSLREDFAFSPERARGVARTETATAQGQGSKEAAKAQGWNEKRWITQGDDDVSDECRGNEDQGWIPSANPFASGKDTIPEHPNCRCNVRYRLQPIIEGAAIERLFYALRDSDATIENRKAQGLESYVRQTCPDCHGSLVVNNQGPGVFCRKCRVIINDNPEPPEAQWKEKRQTVIRDSEHRIETIVTLERLQP